MGQRASNTHTCVCWLSLACTSSSALWDIVIHWDYFNFLKNCDPVVDIQITGWKYAHCPKHCTEITQWNHRMYHLFWLDRNTCCQKSLANDPSAGLSSKNHSSTVTTEVNNCCPLNRLNHHPVVINVSLEHNGKLMALLQLQWAFIIAPPAKL